MTDDLRSKVGPPHPARPDLSSDRTMPIFRKNVGDELGGWIVTIRRLRVTVLEVMLLVTALAVSFRWPGLSIPVGLLFLYALAQRRDILGRPTRVALVQDALALYIPPTVGLLFFHYVDEGWDLNLKFPCKVDPHLPAPFPQK